ncbi:MAG: 3-methyl-2-oxobutanoate hydroxymethyltransferase [Vampirovibrionales bacterium]|nr:3-methyl-2-oxobutanoate hydroxymethyltransferase [Vampirovibrionales bacterium]
MSLAPQANPSANKSQGETQAPRKQVSAQSLQAKKRRGEKIVSLTCYDYSTAKILDEAGCVDFLLVGDSLAMTVLGHPNTLSVTVDEMLHHAKAVVRGAQYALVIADMPFMSYQNDHASAIANAARFLQEAGVTAVKIEGASGRILEVIRHLSEIGIPVMAHLGLTPQSIHTLGGYKVQGKSIEAAKKLYEDALAVQEAGAFSLVLEMVPSELAQVISQRLKIPTIGIGAGNGCDGQVLVIDDILGRYGDLSPRFVRRYVESKPLIQQAARQYAKETLSGDFPNNQREAFSFPTDLLPELMLALDS